MKKYYENNLEEFYKWFVGFVEGDGSFSVLKYGGKWYLSFQITQSIYNIKLLYWIKSVLKVGTMNIEKDSKKVTYRIRVREHLRDIIIPIFTKYTMYTSKEYDFNILRKSMEIINNPLLEIEEKDKLLSILKSSSTRPINYLPTIFQKSELISLSDSWVVGFWEAEGSFYILKKDEQRYVHTVGITQKLDLLVLEALKDKLNITPKIKFKIKHNFYSLETSNKRCIENINKFLKNKLIGVKSLEFRIWSRTLKFRNQPDKLLRVQTILRNLRSIRPDNENHGNLLISSWIYKNIQTNS